MQKGDEIWKPIPQTLGQLEASNRGRIRRVMTAMGKVIDPPEIINPVKGTRYLVIHYSLKGRSRNILLQNALLSAFVSPPPSPKHYALFADGDKKNFTLDNLLWGRAEVRNQLRRIHGTYKERPHRMIDGDICYQCIYCKEWKPRTGYYKLTGSISALGNRNTVCGIASDCKTCSNQKRAERRRAKRQNSLQGAE